MVEIQVRTFGQDAWANMVEAEGRAAGQNYKAGQGEHVVLDFFALVADLIGAIELSEEHPGLTPRLAAAYELARPYLVHPRLRDL